MWLPALLAILAVLRILNFVCISIQLNQGKNSSH